MINILVISEFLDEFNMYLRNNGIKINHNVPQTNPFVTNINNVEVAYYNTSKSDKILTNIYDKIIFISRPKWIVDLEAHSKTNIINQLYDNNLVKSNKFKYI